MGAVKRRFDGRWKPGRAVAALVAVLATSGGCASSGNYGCSYGGGDEPLAVVAGVAAMVGFLAGLVLLSDDCGGHVSYHGTSCASSYSTNYDLVRSWQCDR